MYVLLLWTIFAFAEPDNECKQWFKDKGLKPGPSCLLACTSAGTDMGTFVCPDECDDLCRSEISEKFFFKISDLYPGLTAEEKGLAAKEPLKTIQAYKLSWEAEDICSEVYFKSRTNDESDACRHFVWAILLTRELGADFANRILNAHEQDPKEPKPEQAMDLANNRLGIIVAGQLFKHQKFGEHEILEAFRENLINGRFIILKKAPTPGSKK